MTCRNFCSMMEHYSYFGYLNRKMDGFKPCYTCYKLLKTNKAVCPCCNSRFRFMCRTGIHELDTLEELHAHNMRSRMRRERE